MRIFSAFSKVVIVGCIVGATVPAALAQDGNRPQRGGGQGGGQGGGRGGMGMGRGMGGGGLLSLAQMEEVRKELKVDEDQTKELEAAQEEIRAEMRTMMEAARAAAPAGGGNPGPPDMTKFREFQAKSDSKVEEILDPKQMDRLLGLLIQRDGVRSVNTAILATRLKVTDDQKTKMGEVEKEAGEAMRSMFSGGPPSGDFREKMETMRKENEEKLQAILTAEQKATMESMKGEKFEFPAPQFGPGGPGGGRGGRNRAPGA